MFPTVESAVLFPAKTNPLPVNAGALIGYSDIIVPLPSYYNPYIPPPPAVPPPLGVLSDIMLSAYMVCAFNVSTDIMECCFIISSSSDSEENFTY